MMILEVLLNHKLRRVFDYLPGDAKAFLPGQRVRVSFGRRELVGIVYRLKSHSDLPQTQLKTILEKIDETPVVSPHLLTFCQWISQYYQYALGEVVFYGLPKGLRQGKALPDAPEVILVEKPCQLPLEMTEEQNHAYVQITAALEAFTVFFLRGITGSGKTEVYLRCIDAVLKKQRSALILVPEIGLTPQIIERFQARFSVPIIAWHSGLSDKQRLSAWRLATQNTAYIVIGTRSALFASLPNLGMIILDEAHDLSFKQQSGLRYSARDCAIKRASLLHIPIVLGSATPSLESLYNIQQKKYQLLELTKRVGQAVSPMIHTIDIRGQNLLAGMGPLLIAKMREVLQKGQQILLFLNRRGYAPILMCHDCGWLASCTRCDAHFTLHHDPDRLMCHHCGKEQRVFSSCQACGQKELGDVGVGTEKLEKMLQSIFKEEVVVRIDRDTTRKKGSMEKLLEQVHLEKARILIGTQMLAKGHHFPKLTLVAIIDADSGLFSADFRGMERMAQLIVQVSGRAGRAEEPGAVYIQTHHPQHVQLQALLEKGYLHFANELLKEREAMQMPPFRYFALIRAESVKKTLALDFLKSARQSALSIAQRPTLLGPISAPMEKRAGKYRAQLLLQAESRGLLQQFLSHYLDQLDQLPLAKKVRWSLDVDPMEMY